LNIKVHALPSIWRCGIRGRFDFLICFSEVHKKATQIIRDCFLSVRALTEEEIGKVYMSDSEQEELNPQREKKIEGKGAFVDVKSKMSKATKKTVDLILM